MNPFRRGAVDVPAFVITVVVQLAVVAGIVWAAYAVVSSTAAV